jgi:hypothetical protein
MYPGLILDCWEGVEKFIDECGDNPAFRMIYRPPVDEADTEGMQIESEKFCYAARMLENCELFFDEVDSFYHAADKPPQLLALLNYGRNHQVTMRGVVRRPQVKMPTDWMSETTRLTIFNTQNLQDLYLLEARTGIERGEFTCLEAFQYWEWNDGDVEKKTLPNPYEVSACISVSDRV